MKKIIILSLVSVSLIGLVSCSLPGQSQNTRGDFSKMGRGRMRGGEDISDIVRLKDRKGGQRGEMMGSGNFQRFGSGTRMGSGTFIDRFSSLSQEDKDLMRKSMEARRSGDIAKADEIMKNLKTKYPDVFSGSIMPDVRGNKQFDGREKPLVQ